MNIREILSIVTISLLGLCLIFTVIKMTMKKDSDKKPYEQGCTVIVFIAVVLLGIGQLLNNTTGDGYSVSRTRHIWISMTTIPERLKDPWFRKNLVRTINMAKDLEATLILQVPTKSTKGVTYNVPESVKFLQGPHFKINNCGKDEGPITKILPALRDKNIHYDDIIIVCDDDIVYKNDTFDLLVTSVRKQKDAVHVMCEKTLEGYQGFAFRKPVLDGLLHIKRPPSCFRLDDDVIGEYIRQRKIELVVAKKGDWACSHHQKETDTHPKWTELGFDDRTHTTPKCIKDLIEINDLPRFPLGVVHLLHSGQPSEDRNNIIYCFWTGTNQMSKQRQECLKQLREISQCNVILVTPDTLNEYILDEHPLHPSFNYLSETHKADYLRTYFMRFHGGGYSDIKKTTGSWLESFEKLKQSDKWIIGCKEIEGGAIKQLANKWKELIGNGAYICKPNTPLVIEWYNEMMKLMDDKYEELKKNPATFPQDKKELNNGYPIEWNEMLGRIFHKKVYKYKNKCMNTLPMPIFHSYR